MRQILSFKDIVRIQVVHHKCNVAQYIPVRRQWLYSGEYVCIGCRKKIPRAQDALERLREFHELAEILKQTEDVEIQFVLRLGWAENSLDKVP